MSNPTKPEPLAKRLVNLQHDILEQPDGNQYVQSLINELESNRVSEQLETYQLTGDSEYLVVSPAEAFKAVVYASKPITRAPVLHDGGILRSPAPGADSDLPVTYSRPLLFDELLVLHLSDSPVKRLEFDSGSEDRVIHSPLGIRWGDKQYHLLGESLNKAFYWPQELEIPSEIGPWLTPVPSERTNLITGLKRQGFRISALEGITLTPERLYEDGVNDLGVCVLTDEQVDGINDELGIVGSPYQGTLWFNDGSYFKGTIISESIAKLKAGFYGGVKRPYGAEGCTVSTRGSLMDSYSLVPWTPSANRQQFDYAGLDFPVREALPRPDSFTKGALGFPPYIQTLNDQLLSSIGQLFRRISVKGYAGKIAVGVSEGPVQFIIRGPDLRDAVRPMTWLFSPSLPVNSKLMKVKVQCLQDEDLSGNLIQLNLHPNNHEWIQKWYIQWAGRDCDGDGCTLTDDPIIMEHAVWPSGIPWHDTTQYKSMADSPATDEESCIRMATERIRLHAGRIGILDKLARRIYRQDPQLLTWELRVLLSEGLQRAISAQKKHSGIDKFDGYSWILERLPENADQWLFDNVHDQIDTIADRIRTHLRTRDDLSMPSSGTLFSELKEVSNAMPNHVQAANQILELLQQIPTDVYHQFKSKGRELYAKHQARADENQIHDVLEFISKSKRLWRTNSVQCEDHQLSLNQKTAVIRSWARALSKRVSTRLLVGAVIQHLSLNLVSHILDVQDLEALGLLNGYYLPVSTDRSIQPGMIGSKGAFAALVANPLYSTALPENGKFRIHAVHEMSAPNWITRTSDRSKQCTAIVHIKEVK